MAIGDHQQAGLVVSGAFSGQQEIGQPFSMLRAGRLGNHTGLRAEI